MWVLVLLAIVWVAALTPMVLRRLHERETVSSVTSFTRQLSRLSDGGTRADRASSVPGATIGYSVAAQRLAEQRIGSDFGAITIGGSRSGLGVPLVRPEELGPLVSKATTIRRRRVVAALAALTVLSFAIGFGVSPFFYLALAGLVISLAYLGLLAYFHRLAVERAQKVVALETRREMAIALDQARCHSGHVRPTRPRVGGSGWSVPDSELRGRQLVSSGR